LRVRVFGVAEIVAERVLGGPPKRASSRRREIVG
jgi:hypothetical protein